MPDGASVPEPDGLAILNDVGYSKNLRMPREQVLAQNVNHQRPEAPAKLNMLFGRNGLCAKHQQTVVFKEGTSHCGERVIVQRS